MEEQKQEKFNQNLSDHDLTIRIDTRLEDVIARLNDLQTGTYAKIEMLVRDKADRKDVEILQKIVNTDIEERMRKLEEKVLDKRYYDERHENLQAQVTGLKISEAVVNSKASQIQMYISYAIGIAGVLLGIAEFCLKKY